jgi:acyl carrier protein
MSNPFGPGYGRRLRESKKELADTDDRMSEQNPGHTLDSLEIIELLMAFEEKHDLELTPDQREWLVRELTTRIENGDLPDEGDLDDTLFALVRNRGPRGPRSQGESAAVPQEPFFE